MRSGVVLGKEERSGRMMWFVAREASGAGARSGRGFSQEAARWRWTRERRAGGNLVVS
jgi:hypothetical protein